MTAHDSHSLPLGTRLDSQYIIGGLLGRGGFATTYVIRDEILDREFALKEFFPDELVRREEGSTQVIVRTNRANDFAWGRKKFFNEARLLAQFSHPNIVGVRRVFEANDTAYMVLDLVQGNTLEAWLEGLDSPPTQIELDFLTAPLLSAFDLVHTNRSWHLDMSPDNVMIRSADGAPVLLDFGASRFEIKQQSQLVTALVFKSGYSAPEQYTSKADQYGPWTDIYAFGATLYRAVTGIRPSEATARQMLDDLVPAADLARGRYRGSFLAAIDQALRLTPGQRPQSVVEWSRPLLDGSTVVNRLASPRPMAKRVATQHVATELISARSAAIAPKRPSLWWIAAGSALCLVGIGIGVYVGLHLGAPEPAGSVHDRQTAADAAADRASRDEADRRRLEELQREWAKSEKRPAVNDHPFKGRWGNSDIACGSSNWSYGDGDRLVIFGAEAAQYIASDSSNSFACTSAKISTLGVAPAFAASCSGAEDLTLRPAGSVLTGRGPDGVNLNLSKCP